MFDNIREDIGYKAELYYGNRSFASLYKAVFVEGTIPVIIFRMANFFYKYRLSLIGWMLKEFNHLVFGIIIGPNATIGPGFCLAHSDGVVINCHADIGHHLCLQHQVTIGQRNLLMPTVGNYVYCGCGSKVLGKITVGDHVKVGANAVVIKDVPPYCTVAGIPAKVVKQYTPPEEK